jgi:hypothetical protein
VSGETERLIELAAELGHRVNTVLRDVIPAEAHNHLLNAQKELLTALFLIYEHQVGARRPEPQPPATRASGTRRASPARRRSPAETRVQHIDVE